MTPAQAVLWFALAAPAPEAHYVPGVALSFQATLDYYADAALVPRWLGRAVAKQESQYWPGARSRRGGVIIARGLVQISVQYQDYHADNAGLRGFDWRRPDHSARVGMIYLGNLIKRYGGDKILATAAYNCGPGRLESARALPAETIEYLRKVFV